MRRAVDLLLPSPLLLNRRDFIGMILQSTDHKQRLVDCLISRHRGIAGIGASYLYIIRRMTYIPAASPSEKPHFLP